MFTDKKAAQLLEKLLGSMRDKRASAADMGLVGTDE
jgi:hypothetical protein